MDLTTTSLNFGGNGYPYGSSSGTVSGTGTGTGTGSGLGSQKKVEVTHHFAVVDGNFVAKH